MQTRCIVKTGGFIRGVFEKAGDVIKFLGGVLTTPDPNTSAKASRCKWEAYRATNWLFFATVCQWEGIFCKSMAVQM